MITFRLKTTFKSTAGYRWETDNPKAAVCLIHGIGEYAGRYDRVARMFGQSGIVTIGMDLRGHGCSAGRRGHCAPRLEVLRDVDALIRYTHAQYPRCPVIVYGHSLGGNIALDYRIRGALSKDPAGYIISAPWIGLLRKVPKPLYRALRVAARIRPQGQMSAGIKPGELGNPENLASEGRAGLCHNHISLQAAIEGFEIGKALEAGRHTGNNGGAEKPMLLMHGGSDTICSIESTRRFAAKQGKNCTYIEWPEYFHEIHNGNLEITGEEVIKTMAGWILRIVSEPQDERTPCDCL